MRRDNALRAIAGLQRYEDGLIKHTIFPRYSRALELQAEKISNGGSKRVRLMWVELHKLHSRQKVLHLAALRRYVRQLPTRRLHVVCIRGKYMLWDGNHRATAALFLGRTRLRCWVWS